MAKALELTEDEIGVVNALINAFFKNGGDIGAYGSEFEAAYDSLTEKL